MADKSRIQGFAAKEKKLQEKLDNLQSRHDKARENLEKQGGMDDAVWRVEPLLSKIDDVKQQLKDLRKARGDRPNPYPKQVRTSSGKATRRSHLRTPASR
jgi:seryl-tRNA synthetase